MVRESAALDPQVYANLTKTPTDHSSEQIIFIRCVGLRESKCYWQGTSVPN